MGLVCGCSGDPSIWCTKEKDQEEIVMSVNGNNDTVNHSNAKSIN